MDQLVDKKKTVTNSVKRKEDLDRTCYSCKSMNICYIRKGVKDLMCGGINMNSDQNQMNGVVWLDVFTTIANTCPEFSEYPKPTKRKIRQQEMDFTKPKAC